ncbi:MAG: class I SAM-dependent methyltransferase [Dehalococcoidia bacterium]
MSSQDQAQPGAVGVFSRAAPIYDRVGPRFFTHFGRRLVELAQIAPGSEVLDVAAGRGAVLFPAVERVGPGGSVVGIDLSAEMVRETALELHNLGCQNGEMRQMDADHLDFPDGCFDRVLCGFALWFFPQPHSTLQELHRILRPSGRVGLSTWTEDHPFITWFGRELAAVLPPEESGRGNRPGGVRFDTPEKLETALRQAGFEGVQVSIEEGDFVYADEEEWWSSVWSHGIRQRLEGLEDSVLAEVKVNMLQRVQSLKQSDGIHNVYRALFALGQKPG